MSHTIRQADDGRREMTYRGVTFHFTRESDKNLYDEFGVDTVMFVEKSIDHLIQKGMKTPTEVKLRVAGFTEEVVLRLFDING